MSDAASLTERGLTNEIATRWRMVILIVAFALPAISAVIAQAVAAFPDGTFAAFYLKLLGIPRSRLAPYSPADWFPFLLLSPLFAVEFNWPLILFAVRIKKHMARYWPNAAKVRASIATATIASLVPYAFFFFLLPSDLLAHAGSGVPFLAPLVWLTGWVLAWGGLRLGPWILDLAHARRTAAS